MADMLDDEVLLAIAKKSGGGGGSVTVTKENIAVVTDVGTMSTWSVEGKKATFTTGITPTTETKEVVTNVI